VQQPRTIVLDFFRKPGVRVAISRTTLSRVLNIAFPTLDAALAGLERDGHLERHPIAALDQWRPVRGFAFTPPDSYAARRDAQILRHDARQKAAAERVAARTESHLAYRAKVEERRRAKAAAKAEKEAKRAEERRLIAEALARRALAHADQETVRRIAALKQEPTIRKFGSAVSTLPKITLPEFSPTHRPTEPTIVERTTAGADPWAKLKARANAKPKLIPSSLREPTAFEKMTGRVARRA
jgi:hypothetical protein